MKRIFGFLSLAFLLNVPARADVILMSDSFNRTTGIGDGNSPTGTTSAGTGVSDWGANDNSLGGSVTQTYNVNKTPVVTGGSQHVTGTPFTNPTVGNVGTLMNGGLRTTTSFMPALQGTAGATGLRVQFTFDRFTDPAAIPGNGFLAVGFGLDAAGGAPPTSFGATAAQDNSTFAISFQQAVSNNGNGQTFQGSSATVLTNWNYGTSATSPLEPHFVSILFSPTSIGDLLLSGATVPYQIFVDDLVTPKTTGTFTTDGTDLGILTFSSNNTVQRYIDNLTVTAVTTAVPEPTSLALVASMIGLVAVRRSRRR